MKQLYSTLFLFFLLQNTFAQAPRRILFEEFTSAHSNACAFLNPDFDSLLFDNSNDVVILKYPRASQTGQDPFYDQNNLPSDARAAYYNGVSGLPQVFMDGNVLSGVSPAVINQTTINNRLSTSSYLSIALNHTIRPSLDSIDISCTIYNRHNTIIFTGRRLRIAVVEKQINTPYPLGANGETVFNGLVRSMVPDAAGTIIPSIPIGDSIVINLTTALPSYSYNVTQIAVVAFYQNDTNKEVFQSQISEPQALPPTATLADASAVSTTVLPNTLCTNTITPSIEVSNAYTTSINSFVASYSLNGGTWTSQTFSGMLSSGQSTSISFPTITLPTGSNQLQYKLDSINNGVLDFNQSNNLIEDDNFFTFTTNSADSSFSEDFQGYPLGTSAPNNAFLEYSGNYTIAIVDSTVSATVNGNLGGFGNSNGCYMWDFWNMPNGESATLIFDNKDLSNRTNSSIGFSYAHAKVNTESDSLLVLVSTDCAQTWTPLFILVDSSLSTASNHSSNTFYPEANEWARILLDMSAYDGMSDVMIGFRGVSDNGNNLFIDDITFNTSSSISPNPKTPTLEVNLYPNPASESITIQIEHSNNSDIDCQIINVLGQVVYADRFTKDNYSLDIQQLAKGTYWLIVKQDKQVSNQCFIIK